MKNKATSVKVSKVVECMDQANKECLDEDVNQGCMFDSMMDSQKNDSRNLVKSVGREDELKNTSLDIGEDVDVNTGNVESVKFGSANDDMLKRNGGSHNVKLPAVSQDKPDTTDNPKMSYASAVNMLDSVIVNKLMTIPADVDNLGNEFVIFDEELINDGSRRWHLTLCVQKWDINMEIDRTKPDKLSLWDCYYVYSNVGRIGYVRVLIKVPAKKGLPGKIDIVYKNAAKKVIGKKTIKVVYD
nr:hypothetical protein [Tanacetum cinerariifolium]